MRYTDHSCPSAYKKNVQVPVCPLCNQPVPVGKNQQADEIVGAHMDNDCQSQPAQARRKVIVFKIIS
jgi:AN1-type zinc finger protein 2